MPYLTHRTAEEVPGAWCPWTRSWAAEVHLAYHVFSDILGNLVSLADVHKISMGIVSRHSSLPMCKHTQHASVDCMDLVRKRESYDMDFEQICKLEGSYLPAHQLSDPMILFRHGISDPSWTIKDRPRHMSPILDDHVTRGIAMVCLMAKPIPRLTWLSALRPYVHTR